MTTDHDESADLASLQQLHGLIKTGGLFDPARWARLLDRIERVAASEAPMPENWLAVLDRRSRGPRAARQSLMGILTAAQRWDGHEDLDALGKVVPAPWSAAAVNELAEAQDEAGELPLLRPLPTIEGSFVSIDGPDPLEIDDALWAHRDGDDVIVSVAIASPADFLPRGGSLSAEIARRASTFYHPRHVRMMLPEPLLRAASLDEGQLRPSLVTRIRIDPRGVCSAVDIRHGLIRVTHKLTYAAVDEVLARPENAEDSAWQRAVRLLWAAVQRSEQGRIARGAWLLYRTAVDVSCATFAAPVVRPADQSSPAHRVVGEAMVLCGVATAAFCVEHRLAAPFRGQPPPKQPPLPAGLYTEPADIRSMIRHMSPASAGTRPTPHSTLGVAAYVQASSPLRRYLDLLVQQQLIAALHGEPPPHSANDVERAIGKSRSTSAKYRRAQRKAEQYFTLLHMSQRGLGAKYSSQLVVDISRKGRKIAFIEPLSVEVDLNAWSGDEGSWVTVQIDEIDVLGGNVRGRVVDEDG